MGESVLQVVRAWAAWKATHDMHSAKILCCDGTQVLFAALDQVEMTVGALGLRDAPVAKA